MVGLTLHETREKEKPTPKILLMYRQAQTQMHEADTLVSFRNPPEAENCVILQTTLLQKGKLKREKLKDIVDSRFEELYGGASNLEEDCNPYIDDFTSLLRNWREARGCGG